MKVVICVILILVSSLLTPFLFGHEVGTMSYGESYMIWIFIYSLFYGIATLAYDAIVEKRGY